MGETKTVKILAPHNRKRRKAKPQDPYPEVELDRSYIIELPIEVLANILQYVFPGELLALTRTNSFFRKMLLHEQQQHIWRSVRTSFPYAAIPDPIRISEMTLASILFDPMKCAKCGNLGAPLRSIVPPTRVCDGSACIQSFRALYDVLPDGPYDAVYGIVPSITSIAHQPYSFIHVPALLFMTTVRKYQKAMMQMVIQDIDAGMGKEELEAKYNTTLDQTERINKLAEDLDRISNQLVERQGALDALTQRFGKSKAAGLGLKGAKITNSPTYCAERRRARRAFQLEGFGQRDWDAYPPRTATQNPERAAKTIGELIIQEMETMQETHKRRKHEATARATREAVKDHWGRLKNASGTTGSAVSVIPRWNEFRALPVVETLLHPQTSADDVGALKRDDSTLAKMVKANVDTWDTRTQGQFRKMLGVPILKKNQVPEPGTVPPLDRVTSLFECTKCKSVGLGLAQEGTLTFRSAIKHRCKGASRSFKWDISMFKPDQLGIKIARHAVILSGRTEDKATRADMDTLGLRFCCKLCPKPITLRYKDLIGHLKRHEVKDLEASVQYLEQPADGSVPSSDKMVEKRRRGCKKGYCSDPGSKDLFICRHCEKSFLWNGLVSHVKEKHHFSDIRDEDFYPRPKIESAEVST